MARVFMGQMPIPLPTNSVKALMVPLSTDPNHWPDLMFSSTTIKLLKEGMLD